MPPGLIPSSRNINPATLTHLADSRGIGGKIWARQFIFGFKLIGSLSQAGFYPISTTELHKHEERSTKIAKSTEARFSDRAHKAGRKNVHALRAEAMGKN